VWALYISWHADSQTIPYIYLVLLVIAIVIHNPGHASCSSVYTAAIISVSVISVASVCDVIGVVVHYEIYGDLTLETADVALAEVVTELVNLLVNT